MSKIENKKRLDLRDDPEEEKEILDAYEKGLLEPVENPEKRREELRQYAKATIAVTKQVRVRLSERDLRKIKAKAVEIARCRERCRAGDDGNRGSRPR